MKKLVFLVMAMVVWAMASDYDYYLDELLPTRIEAGDGGIYTFVYDLSKYKTVSWHPIWWSDSVGISEEELKGYLASLPSEARIRVDMKPASFYISSEDYGDVAPLEKSFASVPNTELYIPSVDMLLWRGKFSDDGLMAAFEYYDEYAQPGMTRQQMYDKLANAALSHINDSGAMGEGALILTAKLWGARALAGETLPASIKGNSTIMSAIELETQEIKEDEARWKPISFYTWTPKLSYIYMRDRILCEPVKGDSTKAVMALLVLLDADPELKAAYEAERIRRDELTGKPYRDYLTMFRNACGSEKPANVIADDKAISRVETAVKAKLEPNEEIKFVPLPAASTPETRFMATLDPSELADFMTMFMAAIREGQVSLRPEHDAAWYLYQQYALEPLLKLEDVPEGSKLRYDLGYGTRLEEAFQALYAAHRETHAKNAEFGGAGAGAPYANYYNQFKLLVHPVVRLEPLAEVYYRTSQAYNRLAEVINTRYAQAELVGMRPEGAKSAMEAVKEVKYLSELYRGFYLLACDDLGMKPVDVAANDTVVKSQALEFLKQPLRDGELKQDVRFLLPVGRGGMPGEPPTTYYWAIDGVKVRNFVYSFNDEPEFAFTAGSKDDFVVENRELYRKIAVADFLDMELQGKKSLNRDEFRRLVDEAGRLREKVEEKLKEWSNR